MSGQRGQQVANNSFLASVGKWPKTPANNPSYTGGRGLFGQSVFFPYPVVWPSLRFLAGFRYRPIPCPFPHPNNPTKTMSSLSSECDIVKIADPELFRMPANITAKLKRSVNRGYRRFLAKRGIPENRERFMPSQFGRKEQP